MERKKRVATALFSAIGMIILILDSKTAMIGASEGVEICIRTVIPSLLPFFILSTLLTSTLGGSNLGFLHPLGRLCGMPKGSEYLLIIGFLGGYPVGAQAVTAAYNSGIITRQDAQRMLGFCSNAGPAFIFGIAGCLFSSRITTLLLWLIHIISALVVAVILPGKSSHSCSTQYSKILPLTKAMKCSLEIMAGVCGWVIIFRILIAFLSNWLFWILPDDIRIFSIGIIELANGCHSLLEAQNEMTRFIICSIILGFGGICVGMQTVSVTKNLGVGSYFPGKLLQAALSAILAYITALILFQGYTQTLFLFIMLPIIIIGFQIYKKTVAFLDNPVYNN